MQVFRSKLNLIEKYHLDKGAKKMNHFKKWSMLSAFLILLMAFLIGCSGEKQNETANKETNKSSQQEKNSFPVTVVDGTGKEVVIDKEPKTIVSLVPSNTEISFALGLGDKMVGVSSYDNYPKEVEKIEKVGNQDMNVEKILSMQPDLALVTPFHHENNSDILDQYKKAGINVIVVNDAESFEDVYKTITLIGTATGKKDKAEELISEMKQRLEAVKEKAAAVKEKKKVWVEVSPSPDIFTTGKGTFMNEMLESINAINVAGDQKGWVKFTEEEIVDLKPEVIITTYGYYIENPTQEVLKRAGWSEVPAFKNEQVFDVDNDTVTRPGPRLIDGIETLGKLIYPETFAK
jgi:iron complex transport system substrate-binding protein